MQECLQRRCLSVVAQGSLAWAVTTGSECNAVMARRFYKHKINATNHHPDVSIRDFSVHVRVLAFCRTKPKVK